MKTAYDVALFQAFSQAVVPSTAWRAHPTHPMVHIVPAEDILLHKRNRPAGRSLCGGHKDMPLTGVAVPLEEANFLCSNCMACAEKAVEAKGALPSPELDEIDVPPPPIVLPPPPIVLPPPPIVLPEPEPPRERAYWEIEREEAFRTLAVGSWFLAAWGRGSRKVRVLALHGDSVYGQPITVSGSHAHPRHYRVRDFISLVPDPKVLAPRTTWEEAGDPYRYRRSFRRKLGAGNLAMELA